MDALWSADERLLKRTAKACGPVPPMLGSSLKAKAFARRRQPKPGLRGERAISRSTIVQGMPDCFGGPVVTILVCFHLSHTRPWVRLIHPAFPAPSVVEGQRHNSGETRRESAGPYADEWRFPLALAIRSGERRKNRQVLSFPDFGARTPPRPQPPHPWRLAVDAKRAALRPLAFKNKDLSQWRASMN
jgi:hypothetical protein